MSKQANKTVIGIFVVGAIALAIAAVLILGSGKFFKQTFSAVCYFEGSVGGLNIGAPVVFKGVKIGSVTNVILRFETTKLIFMIPVYIEIEPDKIGVIGARSEASGAESQDIHRPGAESFAGDAELCDGPDAGGTRLSSG